MKNVYSNIYSFNKKTLRKSVNSLKIGNIVSLPTETVYGLGGNAYSKTAIKKIYKIKKRPKSNPLIIHYYSFKEASNDVLLNKNFFKLYKKFCPGPITFILKKKKSSKIVSSASATLNTIAIRFPKHRVVRTILKSLNFPIAMPSANLSSGLSPVNPLDVYDEFDEKYKPPHEDNLERKKSKVVGLIRDPLISGKGTKDIIKNVAPVTNIRDAIKELKKND